ncbi:MAG: hypothetical protein O9304_05440, partial [Microcystis sp. LE19-114.1B]|nr:hypothetical protein [Microcystis sp. LE19-114.1B]
MDQPFESDVMEDLAANSSFGDEGAFDAWDGMEGEGFEGFEAEDSFGEEQLGLEDLGGEGFLGGDEYEAELGEDFGDDYFIDSGANDWDALACIIHESRVKNPETTTRYKLQRLDLNNSLFCLSVTGLSGEKIMVK